MGDLLIKIAIIGVITYGFIFILRIVLQIILITIGLLMNLIDKIKGDSNDDS